MVKLNFYSNHKQSNDSKFIGIIINLKNKVDK